MPGRPFLYRTTADFLRTFGLQSLSELPEIDAPELPAESPDQQEMQL